MKNQTFSVAQYLVYAMLATQDSSCRTMADKAEGYVSSSHIHKLVTEGLRDKEIKQAGVDNTRAGPPSRVFKLTALGKKTLSKHRKRLRILTL